MRTYTIVAQHIIDSKKIGLSELSESPKNSNYYLRTTEKRILSTLSYWAEKEPKHIFSKTLFRILFRNFASFNSDFYLTSIFFLFITYTPEGSVERVAVVPTFAPETE